MAAGLIKLINGLPTTVQPYDQSIYYSSGLSASSTITLPSSGSFSNSSAADIMIILNDRVLEITRDFTLTGSAPYTQIINVYAFSNDSVIHFKQVIG